MKIFKKNKITKTIDRNKFLTVQTPQGFDFKTLLKLYQKTETKLLNFTLLYQKTTLKEGKRYEKERYFCLILR